MSNVKNLSVARCEKKFIINPCDYELLKRLLEATLELDKHAKSNREYFVRSLYFDSYTNSDYYAKKDGVYKRKKIRLRLYNTDQKKIKLEAKNKYGKYMVKKTGFVSREDVKKLIEGQYDCLLNYNDDVLNSIYVELISNNMMPKVIIDYEREAYVNRQHNIRINFDKRVRRSSSVNIFGKTLDLLPVQTDNYYILEVKYNKGFPVHIQSILSSFNLVETSYSKYELSKDTINDEIRM